MVSIKGIRALIASQHSGDLSVWGWSKRGVAVDTGAEQSTASYKPNAIQMVDAGKLGYHLTSIRVNTRQVIIVLHLSSTLSHPRCPNCHFAS